MARAAAISKLMERGTFANIRIRNEMMGGTEGGNTIYYADPDAPGETMSIFDAAQRYKKDGHGTVVIGGKEYGTGSSRDWAAKGPKLQGVRAVITESFERIHRSNLIGMGVAPFCFEAGKTRKDYGFTGREVVDIPGLSGDLKPRQQMERHRASPRRLHLQAAAVSDDHDGGRSGLFQEWRDFAVRPAKSAGRLTHLSWPAQAAMPSCA